MGHHAGEDHELLARLRAGDDRAFDQLIDRHGPALVRVARAYVPTDALAEEVAQETWEAFVRGLDGFQGRSSLKTWLFRILVNRAITRGTRERRIVPVSSVAAPGDEDLPGPFDARGAWVTAPRRFDLPEDRLELLELRGQVRAALAQLPERQRLVVTLRDVEGLSSEEVRELLELSPENQRVLLHRGRARLQSALAPYLEA